MISPTKREKELDGSMRTLEITLLSNMNGGKVAVVPHRKALLSASPWEDILIPHHGRQ